MLDAIRLAEKSRGSIQAANLRVREAALNRSALSTIAPLRLETGYGTQPTLGAGEDFLIALPLDIFGKTDANRQSGSAAYDLAKAGLRQAKLDLQGSVIDAYADLVSAQMLLRTGQQLFDLQQKLYDSTKQRADTGDVPPIQVQRVSLDLERSRQTLRVREQGLIAARQRLASALGIPVGQVSEVSEDPSLLDATPMPTVQRPDIQQLRANVAFASADTRIASLARLPDFELQFRRDFWGLPERYNGRVQVVWNVLDWGAGSSRTAAARKAREAAEKDLADKTAVAEKEKAAAAADLAAASLSVESFAQLQADAAALVEKEQRGYVLGGNTLLDVLDATRALREIQDSAADALAKLLQAQARYLAAQGIVLTESK